MLSEKTFKYNRQPYIPVSQQILKEDCLTAFHNSKKDTKMCFCKGGILLRSDVKIVILQKSNHKGKTVCRILVVITSEAQRKRKRMARLLYAIAYSFCVNYLRQNRL